MQIKKAEYLPRHAAKPCGVEFMPQRLNLICTNEDERKADLISAISQVFWGSSPQSNASHLREGCISLDFGDMHLDLRRDFENNNLECLSDGKPAQDAQELLRGISKEIFAALFLISQDAEKVWDLSDRSRRLALLRQFEGSQRHGGNIEKASSLLQEKLDKYPFQDKSYNIDVLIDGLSRGKIVLEERLSQLERERNESYAQIKELKELEKELEEGRRFERREEYFQLCLQTSELDARIMKVQQSLSLKADLRDELASLAGLKDFNPVDSTKVQEFFAMRQMRWNDFERLKEELSWSERENRQLLQSLHNESSDLDALSIEDAQQLFGLAGNLSNAERELEKLQNERAQEMRRLKESGVDFDAISLVRKSILSLSSEDLEEAGKLSSELKWQKDRLAYAVELFESKHNQLQVLNEEMSVLQKNSDRSSTVLISLGSFALLFLFYLNSAGSSKNPQVPNSISLTCLILSVLALCALLPWLRGLKKKGSARLAKLEEEKKKCDAMQMELSDTVAWIQEKSLILSRKNGFESAHEFFKLINSYTPVAGKLKDLDLLDQMIAGKERQIVSLESESRTYFDRAGRKPLKVSPSGLSGLASELLRYKETVREVERSSTMLKHNKMELRFAEDEIRDLDLLLRDIFDKAGIEDKQSIENSYKAFEQKCRDYQRRETLQKELFRLESTAGTEIFESDLSAFLSKLQEKRRESWSRMQELVSLYPEILTETLEDTEIGRLSRGEAQSFAEILQEKQSKVDLLSAIVRSASGNYDEFYPKTQHELQALSSKLETVKNAREALTLARDNLLKISQDSETSWSKELSEISEELLKDSGLEVERLDWKDNMEITFGLKGRETGLSESELFKEASAGLRKQISWLLRMILCVFAVRRLQLPLVLDNPFSNLDDKRFISSMKFLLHKMLPCGQIIILTSQKVRHQWFMDQLPAKDRTFAVFTELD